jgi:hypothetical protein
MTILPLPKGSSLKPGLEVNTPPSTGDVRSAQAAAGKRMVRAIIISAVIVMDTL